MEAIIFAVLVAQFVRRFRSDGVGGLCGTKNALRKNPQGVIW